MIELKKGQTADIRVQGLVAIAAGVIILAALFLPWISREHTAISGMIHPGDQAGEVVVPLTMILLATLTIFGGTIHILGYKIGIQIATMTSALAFFVSVMVIIVTLTNASALGAKTLSLLIGPWIGVAGSIFGAISSMLVRK